MKFNDEAYLTTAPADNQHLLSPVDALFWRPPLHRSMGCVDQADDQGFPAPADPPPNRAGGRIALVTTVSPVKFPRPRSAHPVPERRFFRVHFDPFPSGSARNHRWNLPIEELQKGSS